MFSMRRIYRVHPLQITRACDNCDKLFQPLMRDVMDGRGRYCSRSCSSSSMEKDYKQGIRPPKAYSTVQEKTAIRVMLRCAKCDNLFERLASGTYESKSKFFFCSRKCKDLAQRLNSSFDTMRPEHYGTGTSCYRDIAFRHYPKKCSQCGYDKYESVLEIHHKDRNRKNNHYSNLEVLCPTCHEVDHFLRKDGKHLRIKDIQFEYIWKNDGADSR